MKTTQIDDTKFHEHQVTAGGMTQGPFAIIAEIPKHPEYCYVGDVYTAGPVGDKWKVGSQFFVALKKHLSPSIDRKTGEEAELHPAAIDAISEVRHKIESGTHKIVNTRLVPA